MLRKLPSIWRRHGYRTPLDEKKADIHYWSKGGLTPPEQAEIVRWRRDRGSLEMERRSCAAWRSTSLRVRL